MLFSQLHWNWIKYVYLFHRKEEERKYYIGIYRNVCAYIYSSILKNKLLYENSYELLCENSYDYNKNN